jgi:hypothetical protein
VILVLAPLTLQLQPVAIAELPFIKDLSPIARFYSRNFLHYPSFRRGEIWKHCGKTYATPRGH